MIGARTPCSGTAARRRRSGVARRLVCGLAVVVCAAGARVGGQAGGSRFVRSQLTWFDRAGKKLGVVGNMADYGNIELSPDGRQVAAGVLSDLEKGTRDIWLIDVATGQHAVFVAEAADENWAIWSGDSRSLVFNSSRNGGLDLYQGTPKGASGFPGTPILVDRDAKWPVSWSADGRYVLYVISGQEPGNHILVLPLFGDKKPFSFMRTRDAENWAAFSPDGKWVAYSSTESGPAEVYVAPFPPVTGARKRLVSNGGGTQARWRRDGKELYFVSADHAIMAATVDGSGAKLEVGPPQLLFEARYPYGQYHAFDVTADGQRFLVNTMVTPPGSPVSAH